MSILEFGIIVTISIFICFMCYIIKIANRKNNVTQNDIDNTEELYEDFYKSNYTEDERVLLINAFFDIVKSQIKANLFKKYHKDSDKAYLMSIDIGDIQLKKDGYFIETKLSVNYYNCPISITYSINECVETINFNFNFVFNKHNMEVSDELIDGNFYHSKERTIVDGDYEYDVSKLEFYILLDYFSKRKKKSRAEWYEKTLKNNKN